MTRIERVVLVIGMFIAGNTLATPPQASWPGPRR